jgi:phosphatidylglycerophosphate synthase
MHAAMDYAVGILLLVAPWLFGFADESNAAMWVSIVVGVAILGQSALTDYEGGVLARAIGMRTHLMTDALVGLFLAISPWLFGFADHGTNAWLPFVIIGLGEIATAGMTETEPRREASRSRAARAS